MGKKVVLVQSISHSIRVKRSCCRLGAGKACPHPFTRLRHAEDAQCGRIRISQCRGGRSCPAPIPWCAVVAVAVAVAGAGRGGNELGALSGGGCEEGQRGVHVNAVDGVVGVHVRWCAVFRDACTCRECVRNDRTVSGPADEAQPIFTGAPAGVEAERDVLVGARGPCKRQERYGCAAQVPHEDAVVAARTGAEQCAIWREGDVRDAAAVRWGEHCHARAR